MNLIALPAFTDNCFEPPGGSAPVVKALDALAPVLAEILVTRHQRACEPATAVTALRQWKNNLR
jgi:hypothetical protein